MANHVRFIDDHCVDSEEIRTEMQKDIDRLVAQLEDQEKQNRTTSSLQTQVQRLEGNFEKKFLKKNPIFGSKIFFFEQFGKNLGLNLNFMKYPHFNMGKRENIHFFQNVFFR